LLIKLFRIENVPFVNRKRYSLRVIIRSKALIENMINLEFTEEEKNSLYYERFHHPHPRVQLKMEVL